MFKIEAYLRPSALEGVQKALWEKSASSVCRLLKFAGLVASAAIAKSIAALNTASTSCPR